MKITILAPEQILGSLKNTFSSQERIGVTLEYTHDVETLLDSIDTHGFYMEKLAILAAVFNGWSSEAVQNFIDRLVAICDGMKPTNEIYIFDSAQNLAADYANTLSLYNQVIYQGQKIRISELLDVILGNYKEEEVSNIDKNVKPKGFFQRMFTNRKNNTQQPQTQNQDPEEHGANSQESQGHESRQEQCEGYRIDETDQDVPLFSDEEDYAGTSLVDDEPAFVGLDLSKVTEEDAPMQFEKDPVTVPTGNINDNPLFSDPTPPPPPQPQPQPKPMPKTQTQPQPQKQQAVPKKKNGTYVSIFQKRTKIILCTGERRSGVSTLASNIAQEVQHDGLSCLVVDLDFARRGQAVNFPYEHDPEDIKLTHSLYNAIKSSSSIGEHAVHLDDGLDFLGTSLYVEDTAIMYEHVTNDSLQRLLTIALPEYDLVVVDCPFEQLKNYPCLVFMSHLVVHSMGTDARALYNTIFELSEGCFASQTDFNMYMSKAVLLLNCFRPNRWNNTEVNEKSILHILHTLADADMLLNLSVLGKIPYLKDYEEYMSNGKLLVDNKAYRNMFIDLLDELAVRG